MNKSNQTKTNRWVTENGVVVPRGVGARRGKWMEGVDCLLLYGNCIVGVRTAQCPQKQKYNVHMALL